MPLSDCYNIVLGHLHNGTPDFVDELVTGQLASCRRTATRRRVALLELRMRVRSDQERYAEAMRIAGEVIVATGVPWTTRRLDAYEFLSIDLIPANCYREARQLTAWLCEVDLRVLRRRALSLARLCALAWRRFPPRMAALLAEIVPPEVKRLGLPAEEVWREKGLRRQILKASALRRAAGNRYGTFYLALIETPPEQRNAAIHAYLEQETAGLWRQLAKELLVPTKE